MSESLRRKELTYSLYLGPEHDCSYLANRHARSIFFDPAITLNPGKAQWLADQGFRRSGGYMYRPHCEGCRACTPLRIPVAEFLPRRSQRRCWKKNRPLIEASVAPAAFSSEQFELYCHYTRVRHRDSSMDGVAPETYMEFLSSVWSDTEFIEFRLQERLVAVAVTDRMPRGLSAVYTFFSPEIASYGLGVYAVLWQIEYAKSLGLPWLYLGYWVPGCRKMEYKDRFRPVEAWTGSAWRRFGPTTEIRMADLGKC